jgi:hypothetical protein
MSSARLIKKTNEGAPYFQLRTAQRKVNGLTGKENEAKRSGIAAHALIPFVGLRTKELAMPQTWALCVGNSSPLRE